MTSAQADLLNIRVDRPANVETTAAGAAVAAGLGSGVWRELSEVSAVGGGIERSFSPAISAVDRAARRASWAKAVSGSFGWAGQA